MTRKDVCLLTLFFLSQHFLFAQKLVNGAYKNSFNAGISYSSFGTGDLKGISYYNEYNRRISQYVLFSPSIQIGFGSASRTITTSDLDGGIRFNKATVGVDLNMFALPIQSDRFMVRLGAGPSFRYFSDSYPSSYSIYSLPNLPVGSSYVVSPFMYSRDQNYLSVGYSLILDGNVSISNRWLVGLRGSYQGYTSKETVLSVGINTGYKF